MNIRNKLFLVTLLCLTYLSMQQSGPSALVTKRMLTNYTLTNTNTWTQFPQLKITLTVAEQGLVFIGYVITNTCSPQSHLVTRLFIDSTQNFHFRAISGNTIYHTNSVSSYVFLTAGQHQIRVEYRTPGSFSSVPSDWNTASLQVAY